MYVASTPEMLKNIGSNWSMSRRKPPRREPSGVALRVLAELTPCESEFVPSGPCGSDQRGVSAIRSLAVARACHNSSIEFAPA
jgi:hypothetical protein